MNHYLIYFIDAAVLLFLELIYFKFATRYKIIDKPNERSSHTHPTIRGGGIIFIFSMLLFWATNYFAYPYLFIAVLLSGTVSFVDDLRGLPNSIRFLTHFIASLLLLYQAGLFVLSPLWIALIVLVIIATINAYNFMDGINGITGFYSLAIIIPLILSEQNEELKTLEIYILIGLCVFLFYNARVKARCFAGDVGSVSMAVMIIYLLIARIYNTANLNYICFLLLYGVDTGLTIAQRLYQKENIFKAHRKHLFQIGCNEYSIPHITMALIYGLIQFCVNVLIIGLPENKNLIYYLIPLAGVAYIFIKINALKKVARKDEDHSIE